MKITGKTLATVGMFLLVSGIAVSYSVMRYKKERVADMKAMTELFYKLIEVEQKSGAEFLLKASSQLPESYVHGEGCVMKYSVLGNESDGKDFVIHISAYAGLPDTRDRIYPPRTTLDFIVNKVSAPKIKEISTVAFNE